MFVEYRKSGRFSPISYKATLAVLTKPTAFSAEESPYSKDIKTKALK